MSASPRLVAIVLAAGKGIRFGGDKLSAPLDGEPLLFHAIRAARAAPVERVVVVARPGLETGDWAGGPRVDVLRIDSACLSGSLNAGIDAAGDADGAFIFLGDMPKIPHDLASRLAATGGSGIAVMPRCGDRPGHPVLLWRESFGLVRILQGDEGAGRLLRRRNDVIFVQSPDPAILFDVDHPDDLLRK